MDRPAAIDRLAALLQENESRAAEVARLLHDDVGPLLSAIGFHLQALGADRQSLQELGGYLEQAMDGVRAASNKLHTNVVARTGLGPALDLLVAQARERSRATIALSVRLDQRVDPAVGHGVYRIIELALDNAVRHAGARAITVTVAANGSGLQATVSDNGAGFDLAQVRTNPPGAGLILMELYAAESNLKLSRNSSSASGTNIRIQYP